MAGLIVSVGIGSAVALPTAHELLHRRSRFDGWLARLMTALCCYGHMAVEHFHHHATVGELESGATARRGMSVYRFAVSDFVQGLRNAWRVERARLRRSGLSWWHNQVVSGYLLALGLFALFSGIWGRAGGILFLGQAVFAVFVRAKFDLAQRCSFPLTLTRIAAWVGTARHCTPVRASGEIFWLPRRRWSRRHPQARPS